MDSHQRIHKILNPQSFFPRIFDFHCHFHDDLFSYMTQYSIKVSNMMPSWRSYDILSINNKYNSQFLDYLPIIEQFQKYKEKIKNKDQNEVRLNLFIPILFNHTPADFEGIINKYHPNGAKIHPLQNFTVSKEQFEPYFEIVQKKKMPIYIHTDWIPSAEFGKYQININETFGQITDMYPSIKFIMGHAGNSDSWVNIWKLLKKRSNVYVETSMAPSPGELEKIIQKIGPNKIVFGSNFPFCDPSVELMKIIMLNHVSDEEKNQIVYDNALKIMEGTSQ